MTQDFNQDWEREALKDEIFAQERASLLEQEYYEYFRLPAKVIAKITYKKTKKHGIKDNTKSLSGTSKKGV